MRVDFWLARTGAYLSHNQGLTVEHIQALRELKPGDRLVVYINEAEEGKNRPGLTLKKLESKQRA